MAALWFDKLVILDPVGASWDTIGADHIARDAVPQLKDAGILEIVTPATVLAKYERPIAEAIRRDMADREFLDLCDTQSRPAASNRCVLSLGEAAFYVALQDLGWVGREKAGWGQGVGMSAMDTPSRFGPKSSRTRVFGETSTPGKALFSYPAVCGGAALSRLGNRQAHGQPSASPPSCRLSGQATHYGSRRAFYVSPLWS